MKIDRFTDKLASIPAVYHNISYKIFSHSTLHWFICVLHVSDCILQVFKGNKYDHTDDLEVSKTHVSNMIHLELQA